MSDPLINKLEDPLYAPQVVEQDPEPVQAPDEQDSAPAESQASESQSSSQSQDEIKEWVAKTTRLVYDGLGARQEPRNLQFILLRDCWNVTHTGLQFPVVITFRGSPTATLPAKVALYIIESCKQN